MAKVDHYTENGRDTEVRWVDILHPELEVTISSGVTAPAIIEELDEVWAQNAIVHIEREDAGAIWMSVNGLHIVFRAQKKGVLSWFLENDGAELVRTRKRR